MAGSPQIVRATDTVVYVNGKVFGVATGMSFETSPGLQARYGIDLQKPVDLITTQVVTRGTIQMIKKHNDAGVTGVGIIPATIKELSRARYFYLQLVDSFSDIVIYDSPETSLVSQQWRVSARGVCTGSFSFLSTEATDEF